MARKILLESSPEPALFTLIGISCHLADYRLLFALNRELDFSFTRERDFSLNTPIQDRPEAGFSFYRHYDEDQRLSYYLISNRNGEAMLLPALKQADFLFLIEGSLPDELRMKLLSSIRRTPHVLTAFELKFSQVKNYQSFLDDLELHLLGIHRESKQKSNQFT